MKILVVLNNLHFGGISKSLMNFLNIISKDNQCDLLLFDRDSAETFEIPNNVNVLPSDKNLSILGISQRRLIKTDKVLFIKRLFFWAIAKIFGGQFARKILFYQIPKLTGYDLAISYTQDIDWQSLPFGCNDFVIKNVNATKKITFVHCDYKSFGGYNKRQEEIYSKFDYIIGVSEPVSAHFSEMFSNLKDRVRTCENFINVNEVLSKSNDPAAFECVSGEFIFLSVCRLSKEKGLYRVIEAIRKLIDEGYDNFKWFIVGGGPEYHSLENIIKKEKLNDIVFLKGETSNPYSYMRQANVLLLPSYNEAAPMVFGEAKVLRLPVLTTNTCSAKYFIEKNHAGIVCENSEKGIYEAMRQVLNSPNVLGTISVEQALSVNKNAHTQLNCLLSEIKSKK